MQFMYWLLPLAIRWRCQGHNSKSISASEELGSSSRLINVYLVIFKPFMHPHVLSFNVLCAQRSCVKLGWVPDQRQISASLPRRFARVDIHLR